MFINNIITQITESKKELSKKMLISFKSIQNRVRNKQNNYDFRIMDDCDELNSNIEFNEQFDLMFDYAQLNLKKYLDEYLVNKNEKEFYDEFPVVNYLFNKTRLNRPFNEKIQIKKYNINKTLDDLKFLLDLTENCRINNKIIRSCFILSIYDYLIVNYKFCCDHLEFKQAIINKTKELMKNEYGAIEYSAYRMGNKNIFKIWHDQIVDQKSCC